MESARSLTRAASRRQAPTAAGAVAAAAAAGAAVSMASISSESSGGDNQPGLEDIAALTHHVRHFKEALAGLRRAFGPHPDKPDAPQVTAHERLGEVTRILRLVLDHYPALQSADLLQAAGGLIHHIKGCSDDKASTKEFFEAVDQLALAFSSRVSEYLMGDLDTSTLASSPIYNKTKSCECVGSEADAAGDGSVVCDPHSQHVDSVLLESEQGVEYALHRAKLWAKYAKDVMMYVETRAHLEMAYTKKLGHLASSIRRVIDEEVRLPVQDIYCNALDNDMEKSQSNEVTGNLLLGNKFIEPLSNRRAEHERARKQLKKTLRQEMMKVREAVRNMNNARQAYTARHKEWSRLREAVDGAAESGDECKQAKLALKEEQHKFSEAESSYKLKIAEANEQHGRLEVVKKSVLQQVREMIVRSDEVMKTVTVAYFQLQHTFNTPLPMQFKALCERSRSYQPGSEYVDLARRLPRTKSAPGKGARPPFFFQPYSECDKDHAQGRDHTSSAEGDDLFAARLLETEGGRRGDTGALKRIRGSGSCPEKVPAKPTATSGMLATRGKTGGEPALLGTLSAAKLWSSSMGSDTDSICSSHSNKSHDTSPVASPRLAAREIEMASLALADDFEDNDSGDTHYTTRQGNSMSKAAETHSFRKLKSPSRCRECDSYVYFQGVDCSECGLACHKKCMESLAIQCGHRRLPRKMTTFGVDIGQHLAETSAVVPRIMLKCLDEIDGRGLSVKGIYRMSGVKSKVERLCQAFENGADLVDLSDMHPNVVASVLKLYLRQLPEPLLTFRLYPEFVRIGRECPATLDEQAACRELTALVKKLPHHLYLTLAVLMRHLHRVSLESTTNNMPASNLGIVFGPTLLRTADGSASLSSLEDTVNQTHVVELMIQHAEEMFSAQDEVTAREIHVRSPPHHAHSSSFGLVRSFSFMDKMKRAKDVEHDSLEHMSEATTAVSKELHQVDELMASSQDEEEIPYFLLPEDSPQYRTPSVVVHGATAPSIFRGSLKDYQGLEGVRVPTTP